MRIAIFGAGIAGPTLAYWLQRDGHETTIVERASAFRTGGYMIDFWGVGYEVAERMGVLPAILRAGYPISEVRFVDDAGRRAGGFQTAVVRQLLNGRFTSLPRGDLAAAVYASLGGRVETVFGVELRSLEEHGRGVIAGFEHGPSRKFDLVIGADGLHSVVRTLTFGRPGRFERQLGYRVAVFEVPGYRPRDELRYIGHSAPGRLAARVALRGDRTMILLVFREDRAPGPEPADGAEAKAQLRRAFADAGWECPRMLDALGGVEDLYFDRVSQIRMHTWSKGRVVLVGDAAACVSLLAGEGSGLAMLEAYVLAGELSRTDDPRRAFHHYEQRLRSFIESKQESARRFASAFAPATRLGIWLRNYGTTLLTLPPLARLLIGRGLRDDVALPGYDGATSGGHVATAGG